MHTYEGEPIPEGERPRITFSIEGQSHPFLVKQTELAEEAAERLGADLSVVSADDDVNKQLSDVETALARGTDGLLMMPANTEGLRPILSRYEQQEVPYAFTIKGMENVDAATQVLAPYAREGQMLGEFVVEHFEGADEPVQVAIISGIPGDLSSVARVGTFKRELLEAGNFEIVAEQPGEYRRQPSQQAMEGILAANPEVDLVMGANDEGALGAMSAIQAAGAGGNVEVVGIDGQEEMFTAIEDGRALATVTHRPNADKAVETIVNYLRGEPVPTFQVFPGELVTQEKITAGEVEPAF
jgi:ribose transport system substrate-binding protein